MPIDKVIAALDDLQKYCAEMAHYPDSAPTWFQRLKACRSPEEMAGLLNTDSRIFCTLVDASCVGAHDSVCIACTTEWLGREAEA